MARAEWSLSFGPNFCGANLALADSVLFVYGLRALYV